MSCIASGSVPWEELDLTALVGKDPRALEVADRELTVVPYGELEEVSKPEKAACTFIMSPLAVSHAVTMLL